MWVVVVCGCCVGYVLLRLILLRPISTLAKFFLGQVLHRPILLGPGLLGPGLLRPNFCFFRFRSFSGVVWLLCVVLCYCLP